MLDLIAATATQAMLVLTPNIHPTKSTASESSLRSTVLVVPFTVPAVSTIANAIGLASLSDKWIVQDKSSPAYSELDKSQVALLESMRTLSRQNRPEGASAAFFEWSKNATPPDSQQVRDRYRLPLSTY